MPRGLPRILLVVSALAVLFVCLVAPATKVHGAAPPNGVLTYDKDGNFVVPQDYREWIFLSSGIDMVYGPKGSGMANHSMFDNVFVNPAAYHYFLAKGTWPDKTVMILEIRGAETHASINRGGHSQGTDMMGMEVHLKDASRFAGGWAFFDVKPSGVGTLIPPPADCYTCHREHAAVDTTFVQFYPTLLPIATRKGTLSAAYVKESGAAETGK